MATSAVRAATSALSLCENMWKQPPHQIDSSKSASVWFFCTRAALGLQASTAALTCHCRQNHHPLLMVRSSTRSEACGSEVSKSYDSPISGSPSSAWSFSPAGSVKTCKLQESLRRHFKVTSVEIWHLLDKGKKMPPHMALLLAKRKQWIQSNLKARTFPLTSSQALQLPLFLPGMGMKWHECDNWLQNHKSLSPTRRLPPLQLWKLPLMLLDGRHDKFHKCWHVHRTKMKCHVLEWLFLQEVEILLLLISSKTNGISALVEIRSTISHKTSKPLHLRHPWLWAREFQGLETSATTKSHHNHHQSASLLGVTGKTEISTKGFQPRAEANCTRASLATWSSKDEAITSRVGQSEHPPPQSSFPKKSSFRSCIKTQRIELMTLDGSPLKTMLNWGLKKQFHQFL